jgi:hypothetical protein
VLAGRQYALTTDQGNRQLEVQEDQEEPRRETLRNEFIAHPALLELLRLHRL